LIESKALAEAGEAHPLQTDRHSADAGLQMALFHASGAHVP